MSSIIENTLQFELVSGNTCYSIKKLCDWFLRKILADCLLQIIFATEARKARRIL